jgi:subtilase family serine protease
VAALPAGASSTNTVTVTIPATLPLGAYFLIACADDRDTVTESDETNNCRASSTTVTVGRPDLVVSSVSDPPGAALAGARFSVTHTTVNQGPIAAAPRPRASTSPPMRSGTAGTGGSRVLAVFPRWRPAAASRERRRSGFPAA